MSRMLVLMAFVAVVVSACANTDTGPLTTDSTGSAVPSSTSVAPVATPTTEPSAVVVAPDLNATTWNVTAYSQGSGITTNVWKTEVTISFAADGTVFGSAGCNGYQATWMAAGAYDPFESGNPDSNDGQTLIFEDLSWTEMTCDDDAVMEQEVEILDLLQRAGRWVLIRGAFHLRDSQGTFLFEADPQ